MERIIKTKQDEIELLKEEGNASLQKALSQKAALEKEIT